MAIEDHCGYCPKCGQASLARRREFDECVWCATAVEPIPDHDANNPHRMDLNTLVTLHGLMRTEKVELTQIVHLPWQANGRTSELWHSFGYSTPKVCETSMRKTYLRWGWPTTSYGTHGEPGIRDCTTRRKLHDDRAIELHAEHVRDGTSMWRLAADWWDVLDFASQASMCAALGQAWDRLGLIYTTYKPGGSGEPREDEGEVRGPGDGAGDLGGLDEVAEDAQALPQVQPA